MTGHTPGPWKTSFDGQAIIEEDTKGTFVALIHVVQGKHIYANARLIAAAPELLEALELATYELNAIRARDGHPVSYQFGPNGPIRIDLCTDEWWDELTEKCFAAIAKATAS